MFWYGVFFLLLLVLLPAPLPVYAGANSTYKTLTLLNNSSPVETAAAHGVGGFQVGMGLGVIPLATTSDENLHSDLKLSGASKSINTQKLWVTKGLFYPVDIGFNLSQHQDSGMTTAGGYVQYTIFEALALPAFALRAGASNLFGAEHYRLQSKSLDAIASWGFWIASVFASYGVSQHQFTDLREGASSQKTDQSQGLGAYFQVLPPFLVLAFEVRQDGDTQRNYNMKLSVGL